VTARELKDFDYDKLEIGEELGSYEYTLTQEMLDNFRASVDDPEAAFPTLAVKHDATAFAMVYDDKVGTVNAGNEVERKLGLPDESPTSIGVGTSRTWSLRLPPWTRTAGYWRSCAPTS